MCQSLAELRAAVERYGARFDAAVLSHADAAIALRLASAMEHICATLKALAAARVADSGGWREQGERSAAHGLARTTGSTLGEAERVLHVGRRLAEQPEVATAARRGELSGAQAAAITSAAAADPASAPRLLEASASGSLSELLGECARTKAAAVPDAEARRAAVRSARRLRDWTDTEGVWHLRARGNPEDGAQVMSALAPIRDQLFAEARAGARREHPDAYAFDALVTLAMESSSPPAVAAANPAPGAAAAPADGAAAAGGDGAGAGAASTGAKPRRRRGAPVKLILRVDYDTWLRGFPIEGETCELAGYGPVSMSAVHDMVEQGDAFVSAVLERTEALVGVAHLGRRPTARQMTALEWLYPTCNVLGCAVGFRLEVDHRVEWAKTHHTLLEQLDHLCGHHHDLKTRFGWALVAGRGKRAFVPPHDPRHPRHQTPADDHPAEPAGLLPAEPTAIVPEAGVPAASVPAASVPAASVPAAVVPAATAPAATPPTATAPTTPTTRRSTRPPAEHPANPPPRLFG